MKISSRQKILVMSVASSLAFVLLVVPKIVTFAQLDPAVWKKNLSAFEDSVDQLCYNYRYNTVSGDLCNRLCYPDLNFTVADLELDPRVNIHVKWRENRLFLRSDWLDFNLTARYHRFLTAPLDEFLNLLTQQVNRQLSLDFPLHRGQLLLELLWPPYKRSHRLTKADRASIISLVSQNEYVVFALFQPANVFPRLMGSCGHLYAVEYIIPFKINSFSYPYANLRAQILLHLGGTMKLLNNFINEPLQWCDVAFNNLGLSPDYPKRFIVTGGDQIYTESRMTEIFATTQCRSDKDCQIGDCTASCAANHFCGPRLNDNIEVFCKKLIKELYGDFWSASNKILAVCHFIDVYNHTKRLDEMQSFWVWSLSEL